ncbi:MAG: excinuclease ABC subunit UvrB [Bacteroidaceae bacterium]|nr:excinuclease ABC subunit UvrB [Prevotellaceae bacterium]MDY5631632.1 excinuclease ABC subunit UvrB [Bacteroidaceae bacterium]
MDKFELQSAYRPTGDQPEAIRQLSEGVARGDVSQVLLGVTGSGKTFTMANVIARSNKPTLILSHNKTLAAQLYAEMKAFFPKNAVEYYVSYYDYYQPEAYIPSTDTYIEKDLAINEEIDKLRLATVSALLSGRKDVIVVSSVSCIYGMGNPGAFYESVLNLKVGQEIPRNDLLRKLMDSLYVRNDVSLGRGEVRVKGDTVDVALAYSDYLLRITFWGDEIDSLTEVDPDTLQVVASFPEYNVYPANLFMTSKETQEAAIRQIQDDLKAQVDYFAEIGKTMEAKRLEDRVSYDIEMIRELGHCTGIENYSRYFDGREPGTRPFCLLDFFPKDFLMFVDESHVTIPQIGAMYGGDKARKTNLVQYGFRLPAAMDNRPLKFEEFEKLTHQIVYVSATPADYELQKAEGVVVEQLIRPTGLLDPVIEVRPREHEADDLIEEILQRIEVGERVLVTTLSKRQAEEFSAFLQRRDISACYIHSDVDTLERVQIMSDLRAGVYDVLVGVNLLREGLDLPEVSLVGILDADQEGFLRSKVSITQTVGRAARHVHGKAILYADRITRSMAATIEETNHRREVQMAYNAAHGITPHAVGKTGDLTELASSRASKSSAGYKTVDLPRPQAVADPITTFMSVEQLKKSIEHTRRLMQEASKQLDFMTAAQYRDEMLSMEELLRQTEK